MVQIVLLDNFLEMLSSAVIESRKRDISMIALSALDDSRYIIASILLSYLEILFSYFEVKDVEKMFCMIG